MADATGLLHFNIGSLSNGNDIIYNAIINNDKVVTLTSNENRTLNYSGYNLMYYMCNGESTNSGQGGFFATTCGWIYNLSSFREDSKICIGPASFMPKANSTFILSTEGYHIASVTCVLFNV